MRLLRRFSARSLGHLSSKHRSRLLTDTDVSVVEFGRVCRGQGPRPVPLQERAEPVLQLECGVWAHAAGREELFSNHMPAFGRKESAMRNAP